jgi:predicted transcriptional regulator
MTHTNCSQTIREIESVPRSVEAVFCSLYDHEPMTGAQLREETGLPRRTIYSALQRLRGLGLLREQLSLRDTRQTYFWIDGERVEECRAARDRRPARPLRGAQKAA